MKKYTTHLLFLILSSTIACTSTKADELTTKIETSKGSIELQLFYKKAPLTVSNFVGLAMGIFSQQNENIPKKGYFFDDLTFHRVVPNFVIQGGDYTGTGSGNPGYSFIDETHPELVHDKAGILSMANSGPDTNGSQFFITLDATPHLDGGYSVFGEITKGMEIVQQIEQGDTIHSIRVTAPRNSDAEKFLKNISWENFQALEKSKKEENEKAQSLLLSDSILKIESETPTLEKTKEGIYVRKIEQGNGAKVKPGDKVETHYELRLYGNTDILDSSKSRNQTFEFTTNAQEVITGWDIIVQTMQVGDTIRAIIPPELGYGSTGIQGVIPGNAFLDFTITLVSIK